MNSASISAKATPGEVLSALSISLQNMDHSGIDHAMERAAELKLDHSKYAPLRKGLEYKGMLEGLRKALTSKDLMQIESALKSAKEWKYRGDLVSKCEEAYKDATLLAEKAKESLKIMDLEAMKQVLDESENMQFLNEDILRISDIMKHTSKDKIAQLQMKAAVANKDNQKIAENTIKLKDIFFSKQGDMFVFTKYPKFKTPSEYADSLGLFSKSSEKDSLAATFFFHVTEPIHTSLTKDQGGNYVKEAKKNFKNILRAMGDRIHDRSHIDEISSILYRGIVTECLRAEIYCQLVKQLTHSPSKDSAIKGWQLMTVLLDTFPPGTDLENFLEYWIRKNSPDQDKKYLQLLHITILKGAKKRVPSEKVILQCLDGNPSRMSSDYNENEEDNYVSLDSKFAGSPSESVLSGDSDSGVFSRLRASLGGSSLSGKQRSTQSRSIASSPSN